MEKPKLSGRLPAKRRAFDEVVGDLRHAVFSVVRHRPVAEGYVSNALGSGFFVAPTTFLTCSHVVNAKALPHKDGDRYHLVNNLGKGGMFHQLDNTSLGKDIHIFPEADLALMICRNAGDQPYVQLEYEDVPVGKEIGVAGYPIPTLIVKDGLLQYDGLIFRVAKGVITATYDTTIHSDQGQSLSGVPVLEVNFLFVPGNSGGPIFTADTGRVLGFVEGYQTVKIRERVEEATLIQPLPDGVNKTYVESLSALYSLGIKLNCVRPILEKFGASL